MDYNRYNNGSTELPMHDISSTSTAPNYQQQSPPTPQLPQQPSVARSLSSDFDKVKFVGKGTYGSVWLVKRKSTGKIYALKEVDMKDKKQVEREESVNEIRILASIHHPNIIRYRDSFIEGTTLYIIIDYADGGDLSVTIGNNRDRGTRMDEDYIWAVFIQIALGVEYLHRNRVLHRDLKSSNVFLSSGIPVNVRIGDLGVAKLLKNSSAYTQVGTPFYISPEIWNHVPYNEKSDVWSVGCILYEMCCLRLPFFGASPKELSQKVLLGKYEPIEGYSDDLCGLVAKLLTVTTQDRPSMVEVLGFPEVRKRMYLIPKHCIPSQPITPSLYTKTAPKSIINTIKVPRDLTLMNLPPSAYSTPIARGNSSTQVRTLESYKEDSRHTPIKIRFDDADDGINGNNGANGANDKFDGMSSLDRLDKIHDRLVEVSSLTNTPTKEQTGQKAEIDGVTNLKPLGQRLFPAQTQQETDNYSRYGEINTQTLRKIVLSEASDSSPVSTLVHPNQPRVVATQGYSLFDDMQQPQPQTREVEAQPKPRRRSVYAPPSPIVQIPAESSIVKPISYYQSPIRQTSGIRPPSTVMPSSSSSLSATPSLQNPLLKSKVRKSLAMLIPERYHQVESLFAEVSKDNDASNVVEKPLVSYQSQQQQQQQQQHVMQSAVKAPSVRHQRKSIFAPPSPPGKFVLEKQHGMFAPFPQVGAHEPAPKVLKKSENQTTHRLPLVKRQTTIQTPKKPQLTSTVASAAKARPSISASAAKPRSLIPSIQRPSASTSLASTAVKPRPTIQRPATASRRSLFPSMHSLTDLGTPKTPKTTKSRIGLTSTTAQTASKVGTTRQSLASVKKTIVPMKPVPTTAKKETVTRRPPLTSVSKVASKKTPTKTVTTKTVTRTVPKATTIPARTLSSTLIPSTLGNTVKAPQSGIRRPSLFNPTIPKIPLAPTRPTTSSSNAAAAPKSTARTIAGKSSVIPSAQNRTLATTAVKKSTPKKTLTKKSLAPPGFRMLNLGDELSSKAKPVRSQTAKGPLSYQTPKKQTVSKIPKASQPSTVSSTLSTTTKSRLTIPSIQRPTTSTSLASTAVKPRPTIQRPATASRRSLFPSMHSLADLGTPKTPKTAKSRIGLTSTAAQTASKVGITRQSLASVKKTIVPMKPVPTTVKKETVTRRPPLTSVSKVASKKTPTKTVTTKTVAKTPTRSLSSTLIPSALGSTVKAPQSGIRRPSLFNPTIPKIPLAPTHPTTTNLSRTSTPAKNTLNRFGEQTLSRTASRPGRRSLIPSFTPVDFGGNDDYEIGTRPPPAQKRRTTTIGLPSTMSMFQGDDDASTMTTNNAALERTTQDGNTLRGPAQRTRRSLIPSAMNFVNLGPTTGGTLFLLRDKK